jgi:DNA invertase Pin-like site-specific DNA recombinase
MRTIPKVKPTEHVKAIGYVRVSTEQQAKEGISLEAQERKIRGMAVAQDVELIEIIADDESGKTLDRTGMDRLLKLVDSREVQCVIIAKLDRITRSVRDLAELLDRFDRADVALVSVADSLDTKTAAGRLVINILVSVSQWERETIGERTRDALRHLKSRGKSYGHAPFGFHRIRDKVVNGKIKYRLVVDPREAVIIKKIRDWRRQKLTLTAIAERLNESCIKRKQGGRKWYASSVREILQRSHAEK